MSAMEFTQGSWVRFGARSLILSGAIAMGVFVGLKFANAGSGEPVRKALTVSGVLTGAPASAMATFRFYRAAGDATPLCAPEVQIRDGIERDPATSAFSVEVPLDQSGHVCPDTLFHDPSAFVEVAIGGVAVVNRKPVNPVPYAIYAQQYGTPDCPVGYERMMDAAFTGDMRLCQRSRTDGGTRVVFDEVVRIGTGASAFWIDRYESTVWSSTTGIGSPLGTVSPDYPAGFPPNGQWGRPPDGAPVTPLFALSRAGAWNPSRFITWFMAQAACRNSGKRLPSGEEWLAAANGSDDLLGTTSDGADGRCVTNTALRQIVTRVRCQSVWGAQDMIGNVMEMTADWMASVGRSAFGSAPGSVDVGAVSSNGNPAWTGGAGAVGWPVGVLYGGDRTFGVSSAANSPPSNTGTPEFRLGVPSIISRGGTFRDGATGAGVFYFNATAAPTYADDIAGFRCVVPR